MASTAIVTDLGSLVTNGPNAATLAKAIAAAGPITDVKGMAELAKSKAKELYVLVNAIKSATDSSDSTNLTLIQGVLDSLD